MNSAGAFFQEMLVLYVIAVLGFFVRKKGILHENAIEVLTQLLLKRILINALELYFFYFTGIEIPRHDYA